MPRFDVQLSELSWDTPSNGKNEVGISSEIIDWMDDNEINWQLAVTHEKGLRLGFYRYEIVITDHKEALLFKLRWR